MLVVDENSVYEIDELCVKKRGVAAECGIYEKLSMVSSSDSRREDKRQDADNQKN